MTAYDVPFEADPQLIAAIEDAINPATADPSQALHFRDLAVDLIDQHLQNLLVADIEDLYAAIDPLSYLADVMAADSPDAAQAAYEQLVTGEWDGNL